MAHVKTRFAPSPTGLIPFGNVRTALFNVLPAKKIDGIFLLRTEDTDIERSCEEHIHALQEDLLWLGLEWQAGEAVGGVAEPGCQMLRTAAYKSYLTQLQASRQVYSCFCSAV